MSRSPADALGPQGPFRALLPGFTPRAQQQEMAEAVADALKCFGALVCEAGTGTGKTFAYLVPALLSGRKIIISTGTRNLQDQLFHKDLPVVRRALGVSASVALLKGRSNYLCRYRLDQALAEGRRGPAAAHQLQAVAGWAGRTRCGDIAELSELPEDADLWPRVTSTADNCLGQDCPSFGECFVVKARREAAAADVVVANHHLFMADMALRDEGFGEVLPGAEAVIFDEAHQLHDVAAQFFGLAVTGRQLLDLARDLKAAQLAEAGDMPGLRDRADDLEQALRVMRLALGEGRPRGVWPPGEAAAAALAALEGSLDALAGALEPAAERGRELENCLRRGQSLAGRLQQFAGSEDEDQVRWFETQGRGFALRATPMDVAAAFQARRRAYRCAWVFTSATLAVGESFDYFLHRLGLEEAESRRWDSPFDYSRQSLLYLPPLDLDPGAPGYTRAVVETALPVLQASRGRAFLLFTSHRALNEAEGLLRDRLDYPLLVQGQAPRGILLESFRATPHAVLLGTSSFWEGVDVRGEALSCVIIDKLPFASPDDPLLRARCEALRRAGMNPFRDYQLPEAVLTLKQGAGRLIRDEADRGVLMICDPRLGSRSYGRRFLEALPPMPRTRNLEEVVVFFAADGQEQARAGA